MRMTGIKMTLTSNDNAANAQQQGNSNQSALNKAAVQTEKHKEPMSIKEAIEVLDQLSYFPSPFAQNADFLIRKQMAPKIEQFCYKLDMAIGDDPIVDDPFGNYDSEGNNVKNGDTTDAASAQNKVDGNGVDAGKPNGLAMMYNINARLRHIEHQNAQLGLYLRHWDEVWVKQIADHDAERLKYKAAATNMTTHDDRLGNLERQMIHQQGRMANLEAKTAEQGAAVAWMQGAVLQVTEGMNVTGGRVRDMAIRLRNALAALGVPGDEGHQTD